MSTIRDSDSLPEGDVVETIRTMKRPRLAAYIMVASFILMAAALLLVAAMVRGHRWFPDLIVQWSPDSDQVIRATLVTLEPPRRGPAEDVRPILMANLARFTPEQILGRAEGSTTRGLAAILVLKVRALGLPEQGIVPDSEAERVLATLANAGSPVLCGYLLTDHLSLREAETPVVRRWALAFLDHPDPEVHALAVRALINPSPDDSAAVRARIVARLRADVTYAAQVDDFVTPRFRDLSSAMEPAVRFDGAPVDMDPWTPEKLESYQDMVRTLARMGLERYGEPVTP